MYTLLLQSKNPQLCKRHRMGGPEASEGGPAHPKKDGRLSRAGSAGHTLDSGRYLGGREQGAALPGRSMV